MGLSRWSLRDGFTTAPQTCKCAMMTLTSLFSSANRLNGNVHGLMPSQVMTRAPIWRSSRCDLRRLQQAMDVVPQARFQGHGSSRRWLMYRSTFLVQCLVMSGTLGNDADLREAIGASLRKALPKKAWRKSSFRWFSVQERSLCRTLQPCRDGGCSWIRQT